MAQKRISPRSTSEKFIVSDRHVMAEEAFYLPVNKSRDPDAPAGSISFVAKADTEGKLRNYLLTEAGEIPMARQDDTLNGEPGPAGPPGPPGTASPDTRINLSSYADRPIPGEETRQVNGAASNVVYYVPDGSAYAWSNALNDYYLIQAAPVDTSSFANDFADPI